MKVAANNATKGTDFNISVPMGSVPGVTSVNKFGRAPDGVQTTLTHIWDRADATPTQQIWVAPTQARVHAIVSTSANDADGGTGANSIKIFGLTSWDAKEVSEDITMNGTTSVNTVNSYVIIHRMRVTDFGSAGPNVGVITATAATDATVTAQINAGEGQTQMAIYGIPSVQTAYMTQYYGSVHEGGLGSNTYVADILLFVNPIPDTQAGIGLVKHTNGLVSGGVGLIRHEFQPYFKIAGPAIVSIAFVGSAADGDSSAGFDLFLVDN